MVFFNVVYWALEHSTNYFPLWKLCILREQCTLWRQSVCDYVLKQLKHRKLCFVQLDWGQIDEHCWSNNVGWQKLNHLTSHLNNVETCAINMITLNLYFGFCQTFQPNKCVRDDVRRSWPITNEQLESQLNSRSCKHGGPLLEVAVGVDMSVNSSSWKIRNEQKLTWKVLWRSSLPQFE